MNQPPTTGFPFQNVLIEPMTNWDRFVNPQFFFTYNASDVGVENHVLSQVGSYGKQLGRIIRVLDLLVSLVPLDELTSQEQYVLKDFRAFSEKVKAAVTAYQGPQEQTAGVTHEDVTRLISGLDALAGSNPDAYLQIVEQLEKAIARKPARETKPKP